MLKAKVKYLGQSEHSKEDRFAIVTAPISYDDFYEFDTNTLIIVVYDRADGIDRTIEND